MNVIDLVEPPKQSLLRAGVLAASIIPSASAPGTLFHHDWGITSLSDIQPSGCVDVLKYWGEFRPVLTDHDKTVLPVLTGSGSGSALTKVIKLRGFKSTCNAGTVALLSHSETIACIRSSLSLQIKELAEVLQVQRPTIYSWINEEVEPSAANRERMQQVYRLSLEWIKLCNLPAERLLRASGIDGRSVLELLKADEIDETEVVRRFESLAVERLKLKAKADRERPVASAVARLHGFNVDEISDQQQLIDAMTGKRSLPD